MYEEMLCCLSFLRAQNLFHNCIDEVIGPYLVAFKLYCFRLYLGIANEKKNKYTCTEQRGLFSFGDGILGTWKYSCRIKKK